MDKAAGGIPLPPPGQVKLRSGEGSAAPAPLPVLPRTDTVTAAIAAEGQAANLDESSKKAHV